MVIDVAYDLDIHGKTKEEALRMFQRHIEMLYQKGIMEFNLIHGFSHGDTLRTYFSNVKNYQSSKVKEVMPGILNKGVTIVFLKRKK